MKSFRVLSTSVNPSNGFIEVVKELTADDNSVSLNLHTFHPETLEWKAAELDTEDLDEVIDGILYEPFFNEDVQSLQWSREKAKSKFRADLADAKIRLASAVPRNPTTIKAQLRNAGIAQRYIDAVDSDPIQSIKNACPFDVEVITAKRLHTDKVRDNAVIERERIAARGPQGPLTPSQRAAQIRANAPAGPSGIRTPEPAPSDNRQPTISLDKGKRNDKVNGGSNGRP